MVYIYIGYVAMQVYNSGCTQVAWLINNADDIPRLQECMICTSSLRRRPPSVAAAPSAHEALVRESSAAPAGWMIFFSSRYISLSQMRARPTTTNALTHPHPPPPKDIYAAAVCINLLPLISFTSAQA